MADDKNGREKQARDADRRQRERDVAAELERGDETEPTVEVAGVADVESELESLAFPATGGDIVAAVGDREVESADGPYTVRELVPDTDDETFDAPAAVRTRIRRPTVAAAMKRVVEAAGTLEFRDSQRDAYGRTFRELEAIDAADDDEGVRAIGDWIVERIHDEGSLPGSRDVRRQAAKFCRTNGYQVRDDEWLGV